MINGTLTRFVQAQSMNFGDEMAGPNRRVNSCSPVRRNILRVTYFRPWKRGLRWSSETRAKASSDRNRDSSMYKMIKL